LTSRPCVLFEGKSSTGDSFKAIEKQLKKYFDSTTFGKIAKGGNKTYYFGIGARGTSVSFWQLEVKNAGDKQLYAMRYDGNGNGDFKIDGPVSDTTPDPPPYDLTDLNGRQIIIRFLTHIKASF
jgi:hypothetical protein